MPTTRKKTIKTIYKDEESDQDKEGHDFSDSGSDAVITEPSSSEDEEEEYQMSSDDDFINTKTKTKRPATIKKAKKPQFTKSFMNKINKQKTVNEDNIDVAPPLFSVKNLTDADKLLPSILNLSESDSSDDESPKQTIKYNVPSTSVNCDTIDDAEINVDSKHEYQDVWSSNILNESEEIAKKTFMELEQHKSKIEETKMSIQNYTVKMESQKEYDITDLLALGEEELPQPSPSRKTRKKVKDDSDSEMDDWEEVKEAKTIPQQGLQLIVDIPDTVCRKTKKIDVEMMMKRKINRVKKEYQVYMHKVHVLCWLGHGNYVSKILNDQKIMAASLSLVPSKECYPGSRVDIKYITQITTWFKDKVKLKQDKNENKFKPKAPPLNDILSQQIKSRVFTTKKYMVFTFVSMLRSLGLQSRIMFNFVTLPIKPPSFELCSLSTKHKDIKNEDKKNVEQGKELKPKKDVSKTSTKDMKRNKNTIPQLDGDYYISSSSDNENIMQVDGSDDATTARSRRQKAVGLNPRKHPTNETNLDKDSVSPPKRTRKNRASQLISQSSIQINPQKFNETAEALDNNKLNAPVKTLQLNRRQLRRNKESEIDNEGINNNIDTSIQKSKIVRKSRSATNSNDVTIPNSKVEILSKHKIKNNVSKNTTNTVPEIKVTNENNDSISSKYFETDKLLETNVTSLMNDDATTARSTRRKTVGLNSRKHPSNETNLDKDSVSPPKRTRTNRASQLTKAHVSQPSIQISPQKFNETAKGSDSRKRSKTLEPKISQSEENNERQTRTRNKSVQSTIESQYFSGKEITKRPRSNKKQEACTDDNKRISHKDLSRKTKPRDDVTDDLVHIIKKRIREAKSDAKLLVVKDKIKKESDEDSDYLPVESPKRKISESDDAFQTPTKISPKPKIGSKKIDRRVLSVDDEQLGNISKTDVWCEVFVEELEEWIAVDVVKGTVHCVNDLYGRATHPVSYVVGWDNNNYLKDLTRKYVPHWNTITRKQRVEPVWWEKAVKPWLGPKTARDKEENERLDRMQLDAPLPKSIAEYKNHPLYALKRHLLKFEAIYPPNAATLGFVRGEAVYARDCVYVCRSRDTWLKEAKVVKLGEQPYKVVKARPKWDKLSNKLITDKPLEVFGPWQVQDYEPPVAENGIVPRNAYGNVELFKDCMLPKGTVHLKLPGLNRVAKKLNIDCAPAMTGFEFNGGWSHPVYDGFVVCSEFEEVITEAWLKDQEDQERREQEKLEARVYGNWRKLIRGLLIKERLKAKYGFEEPSTSQDKKKKGPRLTVKKK